MWRLVRAESKKYNVLKSQFYSKTLGCPQTWQWKALLLNPVTTIVIVPTCKKKHLGGIPHLQTHPCKFCSRKLQTAGVILQQNASPFLLLSSSSCDQISPTCATRAMSSWHSGTTSQGSKSQPIRSMQLLDEAEFCHILSWSGYDQFHGILVNIK